MRFWIILTNEVIKKSQIETSNNYQSKSQTHLPKTNKQFQHLKHNQSNSTFYTQPSLPNQCPSSKTTHQSTKHKK